MLKTITLLFACLSFTMVNAQEIGDIQKGKLNYYNDVYHGRPTASGEIYDKTKVSAAHRDLPMKTMVEVTNLENSKSIFVEINDRTPEGSDAVLELSRAAAEQLDFVNEGITDGQIRIIQVLKPKGKVVRAVHPKQNLIKQAIEQPNLSKEIIPVQQDSMVILKMEKIKEAKAKLKRKELKQASEKRLVVNKPKEISIDEAIAIGQKKFGIQLGAYKEKHSLNEAVELAKKEGMNLKTDLFILSEQTDAGVLYKLVYGYFGEDYARTKLEKLKISFKDSFLKKF